MASKKERVKKMEEVASRVKDVDFSELIRILAQILESYGDFATSMGTIQKESEDKFKALTDMADIAPTIMEQFSEKVTPEQAKLVLQIFVSLPIVLAKVNKLMDLKAEEKLELGEELKRLAEKMRELTQLVPAEAKK